MDAFVDSGASTSLIPIEMFKVLEKEIGPLDKHKTKVMTGNGEKDVTELRGVRICMNHCCYEGNVLVTDDVPADIMLGMDFLTQSKAHIIFDKNRMVCGINKPKPIKLRFSR